MVFAAKQSGMALLDDPSSVVPWTESARIDTSRGLAELQQYVTQPNDHRVVGAFVVMGAGNGGFRGRELVKKQNMGHVVADWIGLLGTAMNTLVVADDLRSIGVPHRVLLAETMNIGLPGMDALEPATPEAIRACIESGLLALIAGGSGIPNQSTDSGIIDHLKAFRAMFGNEFDPLALKATEHGGVYESDPKVALANGLPMPRRYAQISAHTMRALGLHAVDEPGLDLIINSGEPMMLHGLRAKPDEIMSGTGTYVVPDPNFEPVFA